MLENIAISHPEIRGAACIGRAHSKWDERPVLIAVCKEGSTVAPPIPLATQTDLLRSTYHDPRPFVAASRARR
ncbi:AMP-binding enzyme [Paraburkholderia fynbosensis]|uniref:AMP-binding enzyme n=1 Tax=Paraburkholderia fynbosensis TaxID=1200993 RepID=UPI0015835ECC|nr:hypothetical protein [Paraburkholderia fynbosensis]